MLYILYIYLLGRLETIDNTFGTPVNMKPVTHLLLHSDL